MDLQLIFVVETNKRIKSDWIYIKDTIEQFYQYDNVHIKLTPVYMNGKGRYKLKEKEVLKLISQYKADDSKKESKVIYCFDCDDYDVNRSDQEFLTEARRFCEEKGYEFVWFCKDIEQVYLDNRIDDREKKKVSEDFKKNKQIKNVDKSKLSAGDYRLKYSNIMQVLNKYLEQK